MKHQMYHYRLADVFDQTYFGKSADKVELVNSQLNEEGFLALKELMLIVKTKHHKESFDEGYSQGYSDGKDDDTSYNAGYDDGYREGQRDAS